MGNLPSDALVCVAPQRIGEIWPHIEHLLATAFHSGRGDDTLESLKADLDRGDSLLWIVWDGKALIAAATTKIIDVPTKRLCVISACGGRGLPRWKRFIKELENYAKTEHCDALRVMGRFGWKAILPNYTQPWVCLEKGLK